MFVLYKKSNSVKGAAVVETALTIPMVLYLIFFLIELLKIKDVQSALDAIAEECSIQFMFTKSTNVKSQISQAAPTQGATISNFDAIVEKYKPKYISAEDITYYFNFFDSPKDFYDNKKNIAVYWPLDEGNATPNVDMMIKGTSDQNSISEGNTQNFPSESINQNSLAENTNQGSLPEIMNKITNYKYPEKGLKGGATLNHRAFVFTVVVKYRFSSAFVGKLFMGGSNTNSEDVFLIWSRGVGFCR